MNANRLNRRQFLTATVISAAAPLILPRGFGVDVPANNRLNLGFIGVGTQGKGLMGGFLHRKEVQVVAVCDVDTTRRENAKHIVEESYAKQTTSGEYKGCQAYNDFRDLLARKDIDAVVIATPDHWHAIIATNAAAAKKDIYCEKPMSESIHDARAMVKAVRKNKRVFQTGSMQRSSSEFRTACELVRNGKIGKIERIEVMVGGPAIPCNLPAEAMEPGLDWNMWLGPAPERPYHSELSPRGVHKHFPNWRNYREYGGGGVTDWGAHHFDIAQWGLGMDESGPVEIIPATTPNAQEGVRLLYANGTEVIHKSGNGIWFYGKDGKIFVNRGKFELWIGNERKAENRGQFAAMEKDYLTDKDVRLYNSTDHQADWIQAIHKRSKPICDVEIGARTVTVCHLVNLAYYHGQKMKWDPAKEKFVKGAGDPAWLDVTHRGPWKMA